MILYIAGPMCGHPHYNFAAFHEADAWLRRQGHTPLNPAARDLEAGFDTTGPATPEFVANAMRHCITSIAAVCDGIVLLPGWRDSAGASLEAQVARACGRIIYELRSVDRIDVGIVRDEVLNKTNEITSFTETVSEYRLDLIDLGAW